MKTRLAILMTSLALLAGCITKTSNCEHSNSSDQTFCHELDKAAQEGKD